MFVHTIPIHCRIIILEYEVASYCLSCSKYFQMTLCHECKLGWRDILSDRLLNKSTMHSYHTVSKTDPCPTKIDIVPPSVKLPLHTWLDDLTITRFNHLISGSLTLHLQYYFNCTTTPHATLSTMCSGINMRPKVSNKSIPKMLAEGLQYTKQNVWEYMVSEITWVPLQGKHTVCRNTMISHDTRVSCLHWDCLATINLMKVLITNLSWWSDRPSGEMMTASPESPGPEEVWSRLL